MRPALLFILYYIIQYDIIHAWMTCCDNPTGDPPDRVLFGGKGGVGGGEAHEKNNLFFIRIDATAAETEEKQ